MSNRLWVFTVVAVAAAAGCGPARAREHPQSRQARVLTVGAVAGEPRSLSVALRHLGAPRRTARAADQDTAEANPVLWYSWGRDTTLVPGELTAFVRGDTLLDLMLHPEGRERDRIVSALGGTFQEVRFGFCPDPPGADPLEPADTYLLANQAQAPWVLRELVDPSRGLSMRLHDEGWVEEIAWGRGLRHRPSPGHCPAGDPSAPARRAPEVQRR